MTLEHVDRLLEQHIPNMEGWCDVPKSKRMARLVVEAARLFPEAAAGPLCVELGVFGGRSLIAMGLAVEHCLQKNGRVHGIDPYTASAALEGDNNSKANDEWWAKIDYSKILASALAMINRLNLHGVTIHAAHSDNVVGNYVDETIDLLHIDANHSTARSRRDVELWAPKVRPQGYIVFDDINWPTTAKAQNDLVDKGFVVRESYESWAIYQAPRPA